MSKLITSALVTLALPISLHAQTQLVPAWSHTWPFGQDEQPVPVPVSADNHVAVDPSTGNVSLTVDDQLEQASPHFDFLFTFSASGTDLTAVPIPLLGSVAAGDFDPPNVESTRDLAIRDGVVHHAREVSLGLGPGSVGNFCSRNADGTGWRLGLGWATVWSAQVLADDLGTVGARGGGIHACDPDGWVQWYRPVPENDVVLVGQEVVAMYFGTLHRFNRTTGDPIGTPQSLYAEETPPLIATDGTRIFFAYSDFLSGNTIWGCSTLDGTVLWTRSAALNIALTEMEVDAFGRPWFIGNSYTENTPPTLVVTASDGSTHDQFTYGASMNDLAMGTDQAYITGRLDNTTATYLIAIGMDMTTAVEPAVAPSLSFYPQPASASLNIGGMRLSGMRVLDATGQIVQVPLLTSATLDVSKLTEGIYFLEANTAAGRIARRFVVAR